MNDPIADCRRGEFLKPHLWLIQFIGVIVPRRLRADWRQEWEAELRYREALLASDDGVASRVIQMRSRQTGRVECFKT
jgi:hypothetical protein